MRHVARQRTDLVADLELLVANRAFLRSVEPGRVVIAANQIPPEISDAVALRLATTAVHEDDHTGHRNRYSDEYCQHNGKGRGNSTDDNRRSEVVYAYHLDLFAL